MDDGYIYISILGSYVLTGYVSSRVRKEYKSNEGAVGGRRNIRVAAQRRELIALEIPRPRSCRV
jgi:hypothetical protein